MLKNSHGVTLVEILIATAMMVTVVASLAVFAPQAIRSITKLHTRSVAASLASAKMSEIKARPYAAIPVTPDGPVGNDYFNVTSSTGPCDCSNVNFAANIPGVNAYTSSETITTGGIVYTRQTCVNYLQNVVGLGWQSRCTGDTGLKQVVTNVTWSVGSSTQNFTMRSLASPPSALGPLITSTGSISIMVCPANGALPPAIACDNANLSAVQTAEVAIYNKSFLAENGHVVPAGNLVLLQVAPGTYDLHVQMPGYFPFHQTPITVNAGDSLQLTAYLRDTATYGSSLTGEVFISTHPTISKVIAGVAKTSASCVNTNPACNDGSEAVEIYNGTSQTLKMGCGAGANCLQISYCTGTGGSTNGVAGDKCVGPWDGTTAPFTNHAGVFPVSIPPGGYYLIAGIDLGVPLNPWGGCTPTSGSCPWGVRPDLMYNGNNKLIQGNSTLDVGGGGIKLYMSGILVDSVRWKDGAGVYPTFGPWLDSTAGILPAGSVAPVVCN